MRNCQYFPAWSEIINKNLLKCTRVYFEHSLFERSPHYEDKQREEQGRYSLQNLLLIERTYKAYPPTESTCVMPY